MAILPLSVQLDEKITVDSLPADVSKRDQKRQSMKEIKAVLEGLEEATSRQKLMGLGDPTPYLEYHKSQYASLKFMAQSEALAQKFKQIAEPSVKYFPRFNRLGAMVTKLSGELPRLAMVHLSNGLRRISCRHESQNYEANIPIMPLGVTELAARAKECAPDGEFHLLFMPQWELAPMRDPVLVMRIPELDEWFQIADWDSDAAMIQEFMEELD